jgi:hypothetical protein
MGPENVRWNRHLITLAVIGVFATLGAGTSDRNGGDNAPGDPAEPAEPAPEVSDRDIPNGVELRSIAVSVPDYKPDGRAWDVGDGPPDPFVRVRQDGFLVFQSDVERDTYEAVFPVTTSAMLDPSRPFTVEVIDRDMSAHDAIDTVSFDAGRLRARGRHRTRVFVEVDAPSPPSAPPATSGPWRHFSLARGRWGTASDGPPPVGPVRAETVVENGPATLGELADRVSLPNGYSFGVTEAGQPVIFGPQSAVYSFHCTAEHDEMFCTFDRYDGNGYPTTEVIEGPAGECDMGIRIGRSCVTGFAVE